MIDLLLIHPTLDIEEKKKYFESLRVEKEVPRQVAPHIGIAYLLSVCKRNGIKAKYVDMFVEKFSIKDVVNYIGEYKPSVIGFTGFTTQIKESSFIGSIIKKKFPEILICVGGPHPTAAPNETIEEFDCFDFVVCGEAEEAIIDIFKYNFDFSQVSNVVTKDKKDYKVARVNDLDRLPFPAWEEFKLMEYSGADPHRTRLELPMSTSRGCFGQCIFCSRPFGRKRITRSVPSVIEEIERNIVDFGCTAVVFFDETFIENDKIDQSIELFNKMIERGINKKIRWSCEMRVDLDDLSVFKLMKEAGCYYIFFGAESSDEEILRKTGKVYTSSDIRNTILAAKEEGITCAASFILNLPGETEETIMKTIELAKELDIYSTTFPIAVPFPGTAIRRLAERNKYGYRILTNDWSLYGKQYPGVMESETLSIETLRHFQKLAYDLIPKKDLN